MTVLRFTGTDHRDWLQGQVTNDVRYLPCKFGLCNINGGLVGLGELVADGYATIARGNAASMQALLERVRTHVVWEDVEVERLPDEPDPDGWELASLEAGIPILGVDTGPKTLLPELGADIEATHVSYEKGCYVGQEILHRLHSRGKTKTVWSGLYCDRLIAPGHYAGIWVTRSAMSPRFGPIAVAYVPRGVPLVTIEGVTARVVPLPFAG